MRTVEQERERNAIRRGPNSDYNVRRRGPKRRYTPTTATAPQPWPLVFRNGKPLPSDLCLDSIITIFDGDGTITQFIDPTTRMAIDAVTHRKLGVRCDPKDLVKEDADPEV